jgi:aldehyde dehydrogenase (NAD+)
MAARTYRSVFVGGAWRTASGSEIFEIRSPFTEDVCGSVPVATPDDVEAAVAAARAAFETGPWQSSTPAERAAACRRLAEVLRGRAGELAALMTEESGFSINVSRYYQAAVSPVQLDYYAALAESQEWERYQRSEFGNTLVILEAVGVTVAIVPWNVPFALAVQKAAPALIAGCPVILKAPPVAPLSCFALAEAVSEAGFPAGVFSLLAAGPRESELLVSHPGVDKVSFTGSTQTGQRIAQICAQSGRRVALELGGKAPAVLLEDADLNLAVAGIVGASVVGSYGQTCTAQSRVLAPRRQYAEIVDRLADALGALRTGDPMDPEVQVGPMISAEHRDRVQHYVSVGQDEGAKLVAGGQRPAAMTRGYFLEPALFASVTPEMKIFQEEIFGPVLTVTPHDGTDDAVALANDSVFGLSATVWGGDEEAALDVARRIRSGTVALNAYTVDLTAPFGGFKQSGIGREMGREGLLEYLEPKSISLPGGSA